MVGRTDESTTSQNKKKTSKSFSISFICVVELSMRHFVVGLICIISSDFQIFNKKNNFATFSQVEIFIFILKLQSKRHNVYCF